MQISGTMDLERFQDNFFFFFQIQSQSYQEAKKLLHSYLEEHGYGSWIVKSLHIEQFKD